MPKIFKARLVDCGNKRMRDMARKTRIATFSGTAFTAERESQDLVIYMMSDDPISTSTVGDASDRRTNRGTGMSAARLQAQILAHRGTRNDQ
jgi:hypothetical protein